MVEDHEDIPRLFGVKDAKDIRGWDRTKGDDMEA